MTPTRRRERSRPGIGSMAGLVLGMLVCWPALLQARTWQVAVGDSLAAVVAQAADGDTVELQGGVHRGQSAVLTQRQLTLRSVKGQRAVLLAQGSLAQDKAIVVVRDGDILIEGIEFRGARVPDHNGAGIRFERGRLQVTRCGFFDNQNGILAGNQADAELQVLDSEFDQAPAETPLPHLIYVGRIARFELRGSRVSGGRLGHLVKSRARVNQVLYNRLADGEGGQAAYELEFPEGGVATVVGNVIEQSAGTSNPTLLSFGAEGDGQPATAPPREHTLRLVNNTFVNSGWRPALFVSVYQDRLRSPVRQRWVNNLFVGLGAAEPAWQDIALGNFATFGASLRDLAAGDFALGNRSWLRGQGVGPAALAGDTEIMDALPRATFSQPMGTRPLPPPQRWSPGAFQ